MQELLTFLESLVSEHRKNLLLNTLRLRTRHFIVVAEDIYQEHNASALIRTCDCFGIQEMHVLQKSHQFKIETGMTRGADKWVDVEIHKDEDAIGLLKNRGYQIVATTPHKADCTPETFECERKSAFYFGRESEGLSQNILDNADIKMKIPMTGLTESLNISVSAAIILYELTKKLRRDERILWQLSEEEMFHKKIDWYLKSLPKAQSTLQGYLKKHPDIDLSELKKITRLC